MCIPQHVWHDEEAHVAAPDVNLFQVADTAVARRHGDVLELDVHVVLGCPGRGFVSMADHEEESRGGGGGSLPSISLPRYVVPESSSRVMM